MNIVEQLTEYCNCMAEVRESDVMELVNLISLQTCWTKKPCENFLLSERREIVELPDCTKKCEVFVFNPFYYPFDKDSFTFNIVKTVGIEEETIPITEYTYSQWDDNFRMELPLPLCKCLCNPCDCKPTYRLVVDYVAGYEELPDCLLPLFCEALQYIAEKNTCDCSECQTCNDGIQPIEIDYANGDTITDRLHEFFVDNLTKQYQRQLSLITLCRRADDLWGFVV